MIEQGFNNADSTINKIETRVENLEPKEDRKKSTVASKKNKKAHKKRKREDSNSSVVESSKESTVANTVFYTKMQSFYRQLQRSTCNGKKAQAEKEQQRAICSNSEICEEQEKEEKGEGASAFSRNVDFG